MIFFINLWFVTTIIFLIGDSIWLYAIMNKFFVPTIKHLMILSGGNITIKYIPALGAYLLISTALVYFVCIPMFNETMINIFGRGAFLGFCMYGVYECTNYATLSGWPLSFLLVDIMWGTVWSAITSVLSVKAMHLLMRN
jgi:uncharacterized membrane protein